MLGTDSPSLSAVITEAPHPFCLGNGALSVLFAFLETLGFSGLMIRVFHLARSGLANPDPPSDLPIRRERLEAEDG